MNQPNPLPFSVKVLTLFIPFLFTANLKAQILVGPVAGGQIGWITFNNKSNKDLYKAKPYLGFHAGGAISFRVQKAFFLQTSIMYSQRGKTLVGKVDKSFNITAKYKYIEMPILFTKEFKAKFGKKRFYKWQVGAGPTISYWLGGKGLLNSIDLNENGINPPNYDLPYHITFGKDPETVNQGEMNIENPNRIQLGVNFSGGLVFEPTGLNKFMVTVQYQLAHSFLSPDSKGNFGLDGILYYEDDLQVRNQGLAVSIFYFIDLKTEEKNKGKSTIKLDKIRKGRR